MPASPAFSQPRALVPSLSTDRTPRRGGAGPKVLYLSWLARPQFWTSLQVPVTPPLWSGGGGRAGKQIKPREATGGSQTRTWVSSRSRLLTLTAGLLHSEAPQNLSPDRVHEPAHLPSLPKRAPPPPGSQVLLFSAFVPQASPSACQTGWASRWRRPASWCAAPAHWAAPAWCPARLSIFHATARPHYPWSNSWTLVSWEVGPGGGAGVGELP